MAVNVVAWMATNPQAGGVGGMDTLDEGVTHHVQGVMEGMVGGFIVPSEQCAT